MAEISLGIVGTGFIATNLMKSLALRHELEVAKVLTRRPLNSVTGISENLLTNSIDSLIAAADVVVECSGDPIWATEVVASAVSAGRPVVTMNTEFHITSGSAFVGEGVVTEAEGDQPGCLAALHEDAIAMGFTPLVYGNMKGFLNPDPTPDEMEYWAKKQGISLPMVTSFTDGTKVQAEQTLVANHFGATIAAEGMLGPSVGDLEEGVRILASHAQEMGRSVSDFVVNPTLPHGVFLVASHSEDQRETLEYLKLGPGPTYTLVKNNILVHLEIAKTVRRVVEGRGILLDNSARPEISLGAVAKRELPAGTTIGNGIGSFDVRGHAVVIDQHPEHVPIGLIRGGVISTPIHRGELLDWASIEIPDTMAAQMWRETILPRVAPDRAVR